MPPEHLFRRHNKTNKPITLIVNKVKRAVALDMLRGISIFGMVLSGSIPFGVLPAWMYHAQTPPPTHAFNPTIPGITWVDLVLPIFIFCMGAAIPLALNRKIESSESKFKLGLGIAERYAMLVFFAVFIAHIQSYAIGTGFLNFNMGSYEIKGYDLSIISILGFAILFSIYVVIKDTKKKHIVRIIGWTAAVALLTGLQLIYNFEFSLQRRNIIILLLANVYLFGTLTWLLTRKNTTNRWIAFIVWGAIQITCKYTQFDQVLNENSAISWIFLFRMTHYMLLLIPATMIGDILYKRLNSNLNEAKLSYPTWESLFFGTLALVGIWILIALYNRWLPALYVTIPVILIAAFIVVKKKLPTYLSSFNIAALILILGLILEPVEGGIKKDPVTASYLLICGSISIFWLFWFESICRQHANSYPVKLFSGAGSNPLMAYVATTWLVIPAMQVTFAFIPYNWFYPIGYHWVGVFRATVLVWAVMSLVAWAGKKKIYWKA